MFEIRRILRTGLGNDASTRRDPATFGDERGGVLTEYGLLLVLIAIASVAAIQSVGAEIIDLFVDTNSDLTEARDGGVPPG